MAVRRCDECGKLMQEGYLVEHTLSGEMWYYCAETVVTGIEAPYSVEYVDWQPHEMDDEDFFILMNELLSHPTPQEIANVFDILSRERAEHYSPMGVLDEFITFLNNQKSEDV